VSGVMATIRVGEGSQRWGLGEFRKGRFSGLLILGSPESLWTLDRPYNFLAAEEEVGGEVV